MKEYFYLVYFLILIFFARKIPGICDRWMRLIVLLNLYPLSGSPFYNLVFNPLTIEFMGGSSGCNLSQEWNQQSSGCVLMLGAGIALLLAIAGHTVYQNVSGALPAGWWRVLIRPAIPVHYIWRHQCERTGSCISFVACPNR